MTIKEAYSSTELATLLDFTRQGLERRAKREQWHHQLRPGRGGGKEWLVSSMPEITQEAIRRAEERKAIEAESQNLPDVPSFALSPLQKQTIMDDKRRYKALAKADLLGKYEDFQRKHGRTVAQKEAFILAYKGGAWPQLLTEIGPGVSWKSIERWKLDQKQSGTVLSLADCRGIAHRGKSMLTDQHKQIILGQILDGDRQISTCVRIIQARCIAEGIISPSEDTIRRWVKAYSQECYGDFVLFRKGEKAWNDKCLLSIRRDWSILEVGDVVIADGHTLNFETINPETGKPCRMTLLLFFDGASRYPLGWEVMATENTQCISSAFRRACIRLGKFPKVVYLDNGKAFQSRFFKGSPEFEQAGFLGLYRDLGCAVITAEKYHGQSKPIERFFGTMHEMEELMPSYTGWDIAHKPARLHRNEKLQQQIYEKKGGRAVTLEETHYALARWFEIYANRTQQGTHLKNRTPNEVFMEGRGPGVDVERLTLMMLQKEVRTISKDGIRLFGKLYWAEELANRRHPVLVRYDWQLSPHNVLVYDTNGNRICEARERDYYKIAYGVHPAAFALGTEEDQATFTEAIKQRNRLAKEAKRDIREHLNNVVLPEVRHAEIRFPKNKVIPLEQLKETQLTPEMDKAIESAKARAMSEKSVPSYEPSLTKAWRNQADRYQYLFEIRYRDGIELVSEDAAFMDVFEQSIEYQRNHKRRFEGLLAYYQGTLGETAQTA